MTTMTQKARSLPQPTTPSPFSSAGLSPQIPTPFFPPLLTTAAHLTSQHSHTVPTLSLSTFSRPLLAPPRSSLLSSLSLPLRCLSLTSPPLPTLSLSSISLSLHSLQLDSRSQQKQTGAERRGENRAPGKQTSENPHLSPPPLSLSLDLRKPPRYPRSPPPRLLMRPCCSAEVVLRC